MCNARAHPATNNAPKTLFFLLLTGPDSGDVSATQTPAALLLLGVLASDTLI